MEGTGSEGDSMVTEIEDHILCLLNIPLNNSLSSIELTDNIKRAHAHFSAIHQLFRDLHDSKQCQDQRIESFLMAHCRSLMKDYQPLFVSSRLFLIFHVVCVYSVACERSIDQVVLLMRRIVTCCSKIAVVSGGVVSSKNYLEAAQICIDDGDEVMESVELPMYVVGENDESDDDDDDDDDDLTTGSKSKYDKDKMIDQSKNKRKRKRYESDAFVTELTRQDTTQVVRQLFPHDSIFSINLSNWLKHLATVGSISGAQACSILVTSWVFDAQSVPNIGGLITKVSNCPYNLRDFVLATIGDYFSEVSGVANLISKNRTMKMWLQLSSNTLSPEQASLGINCIDVILFLHYCPYFRLENRHDVEIRRWWSLLSGLLTQEQRFLVEQLIHHLLSKLTSQLNSFKMYFETLLDLVGVSDGRHGTCRAECITLVIEHLSVVVGPLISAAINEPLNRDQGAETVLYKRFKRRQRLQLCRACQSLSIIEFLTAMIMHLVEGCVRRGLFGSHLSDRSELNPTETAIIASISNAIRSLANLALATQRSLLVAIYQNCPREFSDNGRDTDASSSLNSRTYNITPVQRSVLLALLRSCHSSMAFILLFCAGHGLANRICDDAADELKEVYQNVETRVTACCPLTSNTQKPPSANGLGLISILSSQLTSSVVNCPWHFAPSVLVAYLHSWLLPLLGIESTMVYSQEVDKLDILISHLEFLRSLTTLPSNVIRKSELSMVIPRECLMYNFVECDPVASDIHIMNYSRQRSGLLSYGLAFQLARKWKRRLIDQIYECQNQSEVDLSGKAHIPSIPLECIKHVASYLGYKRLHLLSLVCKQWVSVAWDNALWFDLYQRNFAISKFADGNPWTTKELCRSCFSLRKGAKIPRNLSPPWIVDSLVYWIRAELNLSTGYHCAKLEADRCIRDKSQIEGVVPTSICHHWRQLFRCKHLAQRVVWALRARLSTGTSSTCRVIIRCEKVNISESNFIHLWRVVRPSMQVNDSSSHTKESDEEVSYVDKCFTYPFLCPVIGCATIIRYYVAAQLHIKSHNRVIEEAEAVGLQ